MGEPARRLYQTHAPDAVGMSDSQRKLERLLLPPALDGKRVLDIGCNEGFFAHEAAARGAVRVVGIDEDSAALEAARRRYVAPGLEFLHQRWNVLPEGPFDLVLWTSAMHYEADPAEVITRISRVLTPDGLFILECGVLDWPKKEMVLVSRPADSRWYPTWPLLEEMLGDFTVRRVAPPELVPGDHVPRVVFHCVPRRTTVMLIRGESGHGKSALAALIAESATKVISLDAFVTRIARAEHHHTDLQAFIRDRYDARNLGKIYHGIDEHGLTNEYARLLAAAVARSDRLVVLEGLITDQQVEALTAELAGAAFLWDVRKRA
jgi:SAM-dependent methyltransferase